jgi:hypothetical protein
MRGTVDGRVITSELTVTGGAIRTRLPRRELSPTPALPRHDMLYRDFASV